MSIKGRDFVHMSRFALSGDQDSAVALAKRLSRRLSKSDPETSTALLELVNNSSTPLRSAGEPLLPIDQDSRLQLVKYEASAKLAVEPVWVEQVSRVLTDLVHERIHVDALWDKGLSPAKTLLFTGHPGVGKTLAARWLAQQMQLPILTLDLAAVMSSFLGKTGNNLRSVLDHASKAPCVLLLDEFDAIAKRRGDDIELGELKRLVTVLLQSIGEWPEDGVLIAATNHPELLDPAVWRRFDVVLEFPFPHTDAIASSIQRMIGSRFVVSEAVVDVVGLALKGKSFADAEIVVKRALRSAVINELDPEVTLIETALNSLESKDSTRLDKNRQITIATQLVRCGLSQSRAAELTGISRNTVAKYLNSTYANA